MAEDFDGFPVEGLRFFKQLAANNTRDWFLAHKDVYESQCRAPLAALMAALEPRLGPSKISRINRDLRFSRNRAPYKTHLAAGVGGFYIDVSANGVWVGTGMYKPETPVLKRFREAIDDDATGPDIARIAASLRRKGYDVDTHERLSSVPRGYSADHPRLDLLQMKDIFAGRLFAPAPWLSTPKAIERIESAMSDTRPLLVWLRDHVTASRG